ncbi:unnamed protein product [Camellia sinensis]
MQSCINNAFRVEPFHHLTQTTARRVLNTTKALESQYIFSEEAKTSNTAGQVIRCKAAVAWEAGKPLVIEEVEVAPPQKMEVRVKILYTSLCHTDVYFWEAKGQNPIFPRILGHEAGEGKIVESVGGVTDLAPGDHVLPVFTGECKEHYYYEDSRRLRIAVIHGLARMAAIMASTYKAYLGVGLGPLSFLTKFRIPHPGRVGGSFFIDLAMPLMLSWVLGGPTREAEESVASFRQWVLCRLWISKSKMGILINTDRRVMIHDQISRFSINGKPIFHFVGTSTFSEYTVVHVGCLAKINPLAPLNKVCVLSCGISTGFGATVNVAKPKKGSTVVVFGLGAVGLAGQEDRHRESRAKKFDVTEFVNPKDYNKPVQEVISEMTNGGVDRSVEFTGSTEAMISAFECVHDGWGVVLVGVPHKDAVFKTHPVNFLNERTLKGTFFGINKPRSDIPSVVEKYMNKELELEKFITHQVPFSEINKAFEYMLKGESIRCIIKMEE